MTARWLPLALIGGALALRLVVFGGLLGWDDVDYWDAARALRAGDYLPISSFQLRHTLTVPLAVAQAWLGEREWVAFVVPLGYSIAHLAVAWALGLLCGGVALAAVTVALLAILPLDVIAATELHADLPFAVFLGVTVYAVLRGELAVRARRAWFLLAGVSLGLGVITKEAALALLAVLALRLALVRRRVDVTGYGWVVVGCFAVIAAEMVWLAAVTGHPLYRFLGPIPGAHAATVLSAPPGRAWMLQYPAMLLNPLSGSFGYFAGIFYLVLAGTLPDARRDSRVVAQLVAWWAGLLLVFNFAPLDATFTRPLFHHFARTLHPLLIPFALTVALWLRAGWPGRSRLRAGAVLALVPLAVAGILITHRDYRGWAAVARQAAPVIEQLPPDARVVTDSMTASQLRFLVPGRRDRIVSYSSGGIAAETNAVFVLSDPARVDQATRESRVAAAAMAPPASWRRVAQFDRHARASLRGTLGRWLGREPEAGVESASATLWRVGP